MAQKVEYLTPVQLLVDADLDGLGDNTAHQSDVVTSSTDGADDYMIFCAIVLTGAGTGDVTVHLWWDNDPSGAGPDRIDGAGASKATFTPANIVDSIPIMVKAAAGTVLVRMRPATIRDTLGFVPASWGIILENQGGAAYGSGAGKYVTAQPIRYIES